MIFYWSLFRTTRHPQQSGIMNNLNKVFGLVQEYCKDTEVIDSPKKLQAIAAETGVTVNRLQFYLDCLHEIGLLEYSKNNTKVLLTEKGRTATYVFPN
jgi:hypothetical protein